MKSYDTIIIGAGMSGLAAASEIYKSVRWYYLGEKHR